MIASGEGRRWFRCAWLAAALLVLAACAATEQAREPEPSGFLTGKFYAGKEGQPLLVYVKPDAQWRRYDKILIDPVTIWCESGLVDVPPEEAQALADQLETSLRRELAKDYTLVERPGPGVMRLRAAITEAKGARRVLNVASTVGPTMRLLSSAKRLATGTHAFVGHAGIEGELLDSMTNERLAAAIDRRAGAKTLSGATSKWDDVQQAFDYWADRLRTRLAELRAR